MIQIKRIEKLNQEILDIVEQLDEYLNSLYPSESNHLTPVDNMINENFVFIGAYKDHQAIGCGGVKIIPNEYAELKRMFVVPGARGKSIGKMLLVQLEETARKIGLDYVRLETGVKQKEAIAMYEKSGYQFIEPFGNYLVDPLSVFMEKRLTYPDDA